MADYNLLAIEVTGDADEATYQYVVDKLAVPGAAAGTPLVAEILTRHNGSRLLVIAAGDPGSGDFDLPVEEVQGDADEATLRLIVNKTDVPEHLGQSLVASLVGTGSDWLLVAPLAAV